ncbi:recombination regulator RecX [Leptothrix discophora]|uniref:recombination regulator RecX n=1 Tax=Leptothrix discophora TaxID=89 RepID=UPI0034E585F1
MATSPLSLKARALKLLAAREHSRAELVRKLTPHLKDGENLDAVLDELTRRGFLDEARYVASVVHRRAARSGASRIRQELQAQGIDAPQMAEALDTLQSSELARAQELWQRRYGQPPADLREAARQNRFLLSRGFSSEVVRRIVRIDEAREADRTARDDDAVEKSIGPGEGPGEGPEGTHDVEDARSAGQKADDSAEPDDGDGDGDGEAWTRSSRSPAAGRPPSRWRRR